MHAQRRFFNIALVFVWALAHGIWIGAGWHAASELGAQASAPAAIHCGCTKSSSPAAELTIIGDADASLRNGCLVCQLSTLLPDVPAAQLAPALAPLVSHDRLLSIPAAPAVSFLDRLPPQRGPPRV